MKFTGLPYDIPYQYNLSEMDKAYMRIMYPSNDPNEDTQKVLRTALITIGMVKSDSATADKIQILASQADPTGVVDPSQIRDLFSAWCRRVIPVTVISDDGSSTTGGGSRALQPGKSRGVKGVDLSETTVRFTKGPMCANMPPTSKALVRSGGRARAIEPTRMRAVTSLNLLQKRWPLDQIVAKADNMNFRVAVTYSIAPCPISKAKGAEVINPSDYRIKMVKDALTEWANYASIEFTPIAHPAESDGKLDDIKHLTIVFQDHHYTTGDPIPLNDDVHRSYTYNKTQTPSLPLADDYDTTEEFDREMKDFEACPQVKHTMCLRGVVDTPQNGAKPAADVAQVVPGTVVTNEMVAMRTITHEVLFITLTTLLRTLTAESVIC